MLPGRPHQGIGLTTGGYPCRLNAKESLSRTSAHSLHERESLPFPPILITRETG